MSSTPPTSPRIADRYRLGDTLGAGGMARVVAAHDELLDRRVAIKLLHAHVADDPQFVDRFWREARAAAALNDPGIVQVYDVGRDEAGDGAPWIAMELVDGGTLRELLDRDGPLSRERALAVFRSISGAIAHAHERGIVHRDIKPHNVMVDLSGAVKVADFGIARIVDAGATITEVGSMVGTAQYLSPEQATGARVTAASDVYSLGVLLFELLTGSLPFEGDAAVEIAYRHVHEDAPHVTDRAPGIAPELDALVAQMLAKDPADRPIDAAAVCAALDSLTTADGATTVAGTTAVTDAPTVAGAGAAASITGDGVAPTRMEPVFASPAMERSARPAFPHWAGPRWLLGAIALLVIVGIAVASRDDEPSTSKDPRTTQEPAAATTPATATPSATVPDLAGQPLEDARRAAAAEGLDVVVSGSGPSKDVPAGSVVRQDLEAGSRVEDGTAIHVVLSEGDGKPPKGAGKGKAKGKKH